MKKIIILVGFTMLFGSCQTKKVVTELADFDGEWKLVRITNGFAQFDQVGNEIGFSETVLIDAESGTFSGQRDNNTPEVSKLKKGVEQSQDALILIDEKMYHWFHFEDWNGKTHLVLYQKCPQGAVLADGSDYYYSKQ